MTPLTDIAAALREHSPGVLPENLHIRSELRLDIGVLAPCPDDIAEAVLRDAMVRDADLRRWNNAWYSNEPGEDAEGEFDDSDHGGSLGACFAAWCWSKGIA